MPRHEGFILPLVMILLLVVSLLVVTLYQAESAHIMLFHAAQLNHEQQHARDTEKIQALELAKTVNSHWNTQKPNPSTTPEIGIPYLRYVNQSGTERIWQVKTKQRIWLIHCNLNMQQCYIASKL